MTDTNPAPLCDLWLAGLHLSFSGWEVGVALVVTESAQLSSGAFYRRSRALWTCRDCAALPSPEISVLPQGGGPDPPDVLPEEGGSDTPHPTPPLQEALLEAFALFT